LLTNYDRALIYLLLFFVLLSFLGTFYVGYSSGKPSEAVISANGIDIGRFAVQGESRIRVKGALGESEIVIKNGRARIVASACPRKVCMHKGWIDKPGEVVICGPNRVMVRIVGDQEDESVDAVSK